MQKSNWVSFFVLVIVAVAAYFVVKTVRDTTNSAMQPIQQANQAMQTQVANLLHPTPTIIPDPVTYINEVRALARLETIHYSVEKIITAEIGQGTFDFLFGDKLLFVAHGVVIAGIDMAQINPEDMKVQGGVLTVKLPPAEIFIATLDNDKSYVYNRETGLLTHGDENLESSARKVAEQEILQAALDDGILDQAQQNAETFLGKFFKSLGFDDVVFVK